MRIACVAYLHGSGGAERQIVMLANNLSRQGDDVSLIILVDNKSKYEIDTDINVIDLTSIENKKGNKILKRYKALKNAYKEISPQVTIHYWLQSAYLTALMPKRFAGQIIYSERVDPGNSEYNGMLGAIRAIAFKRINGFVFQSEGAKHYFSEIIQKRSIVIPNPISVPEKKFMFPCKKRKKKIVTVGRLHPQKNQKLLIEAFSKISKEYSDYTLSIYGAGPLEDELKKWIKACGVDGRVFLEGTTSDIFEKMYDASLFVLSSDYEGMPNALMEAMALGVPCVSTDCKPGGARALIKNGENGYIVPIGNVEALTKAMETVLSDDNNVEALCKEAQKIRESHSERAVFSMWKNYIYSL